MWYMIKENERLIEFKTAHSYLQVLKHLEDLSEVEDYLRFVGRLHDVAGVDPRFLDVTGLAFCHALDQVIAVARRIFLLFKYHHFVLLFVCFVQFFL